jgi:hypothetical protein
MALSEYFPDDAKVADYAADADADSDAISIEYLVDGDDEDGAEDGAEDSGHRDPLDGELVEGALVFIKGDAAVREFRAWAKSRGYLTAKSWRNVDDDSKAGAS